MLSNITWAQYLIGTLTLTIIYYGFIALKFFPAELKAKTIGRFSRNEQIIDPAPFLFEQSENLDATDNTEEELVDDFANVDDLIGGINSLIAGLPPEDRVPEKIKQQLHRLLKNYPDVKDSLFRSSINELIISEWEKYSAIVLTEDEVDMLWETGT